MENKKNMRPLSPEEKMFASENYHLITEFLKKEKLNAEDFFDVVVLDFLLSVEKYLNDDALKEKCSFEAVSYMYMKRAVFVHFREQKAQKRSAEAGADLSYEEMNAYIGKSESMENISLLEYTETTRQIMENLTDEQRKIFTARLTGYSLKEIAENNGIKAKRAYNQFQKIKAVVANVMEINQKIV